MTHTELIEDTLATMTSLSDEKRKKLGYSYYPTQMEIIGVTNPNLQKITKALKQVSQSFSPEEKINLAISLVEKEIFECQYVAYSYLNDKKIIERYTKEHIEALMLNLDNWVSVDTFSIHVLGKAWREKRYSTEKIIKLTKSTNHWIRRCAIVATIPLNLKSQGGKGDVYNTIMICKLFVNDHHDMIVKALSWALRELSKFKKAPVSEFIDAYCNDLHPRVIREVNNKLLTGKKNPK